MNSFLRDQILKGGKTDYTAHHLKMLWRCGKTFLRQGWEEDLLAELLHMRDEGLIKFINIDARNISCMVNLAKNLWLPGKIRVLHESKTENEHPWEKEGYYWHGACYFHHELNTANKSRLAKINTWLIKNKSTIKVPLCERMLEIFEDEKAMKAPLFGGRLPLDTIYAFVPAIPLRPAHFDNSGPALIVENLSTWWSICQWNGEMQKYSIIIYGNGNAVCGIDLSSVERIPVFYFGDVDWQGMAIARNLKEKHPELQILPEQHMYKFILENGKLRSKNGKCSQPVEFIQKWIPELSLEILGILKNNQYIVQETLGTKALASGKFVS